MASVQAQAANAASAPAWRQFSFFDVVPVKDVHDLASPPEIFKNPFEISTTATSSIGVLVADLHGSIHILDKHFEITRSWVAHVGGRVTHMSERKGVLISMGEEDSVKSPLLKIWDLGSNDKKTGAPLLLRSVKIQPSNRPHPVTTIALSASLSHLAIGLADGTVLLYRHLDQSVSSSSNLTAVPKPRTVFESSTEPITGLGFKEPTEETNSLYLFIVTTNRVLSYQASGRGSGGAPVVIDEVGSALGCATVDWRASDIVVARDEAIYICGTEGRGACLAYEGHKSFVLTHLNYLVMISPPMVPSASAASATVRHVARAANSVDSEITKVTVFDLENKFVAFSGTFTQGVSRVFSGYNKIYVLLTDGQLSALEEKPTSTKLNMLYSKSLFVLALSLAKTQELDESSVADIHRQYGDHLYTKGDYDGAMSQYVKTLGNLQPSYVIRKYLDAQRIHNLVTYLQELHSIGLANADHTTLLLNAYTKLKDVSRLDNFIKTESKRDSDDLDELPFDLETAIRVCRQAGYFDHASYLARKYERHEDYLRIQIEDAGNYKEALLYLRRLGPEAAENSLARYGRAMLGSLPTETTQLLIDLCTSSMPLLQEVETSSDKPTNSTPSYLSYLALNRNSVVVPTIVSSDTAVPPSPSIKTVRPGETVSRRGSVHAVSRPDTPPASSSPVSVKPPRLNPIKRPSPRLYFAHFVDHMDHFIIFLETVATLRWGQAIKSDGTISIVAPDPPPGDGLPNEELEAADQTAVWNTLLELYLTSEDGTNLRPKALGVLKSQLPFDPTHALILCSSHAYTPGLVLLWEKLGMYEDVLRFWIDKCNEGEPEASREVLRHLDIYGKDHPSLYPLVLRFLTSTPELLSKHVDDLKTILDYIDKEKIIPPLGIIQVLSRNGVASVGLVKSWLVGHITSSREQIHRDQEWTNSYRLETQSKLQQVKELSDIDQPRVFHVTRCSSCGGQLDLPSVHFLCNHSYHQRCLIDQDTECPNCVREHGVIREIRQNNERLAGQHDIFLSEVQEDGFSAVASAFSRGFLNMNRAEDISASS
ncbi:hypothetical protein PLEOSDRAFT_1099105 [Pleurotus ostreatus PC15]|uniref:E3 ubiquitin-protein ligase PEP5 n=1 Tax=Pleurotus ostreatus (strain PC15) TaxID=1137138 RepID=A0A067P9L7_PLEO1|nr:hypothetical protein PLEOSDRAFT_1099105 [Pleurotus ostreatus PC15]